MGACASASACVAHSPCCFFVAKGSPDTCPLSKAKVCKQHMHPYVYELHLTQLLLHTHGLAVVSVLIPINQIIVAPTNKVTITVASKTAARL